MPSSTTPSSSAALPAPGSDTAADLRGVSQLIITAVTGVTDIVEDMHRNIATPSSLIGRAPAGRTRGITGLVYRRVRGVTNGAGSLLDMALAQVAPLAQRSGSLLNFFTCASK